MNYVRSTHARKSFRKKAHSLNGSKKSSDASKEMRRGGNCPWTCKPRPSNAACGKNSSAYPADPLGPMRKLQSPWANQARFAPLPVPAPQIRFRSWFPATAWFGQTAAWPAIAGESPASKRCWTANEAPVATQGSAAWLNLRGVFRPILFEAGLLDLQIFLDVAVAKNEIIAGA